MASCPILGLERGGIDRLPNGENKDDPILILHAERADAVGERLAHQPPGLRGHQRPRLGLRSPSQYILFPLAPQGELSQGVSVSWAVIFRGVFMLYVYIFSFVVLLFFCDFCFFYL
jgi:hypothetical protein